ncbi:MAG: carboxypeptidase [Pedobacter sp.]|nr:MAG: carboxypeptidase [Pedobacter sp.]
MEHEISDRLVKHQTIELLLQKLPSGFNVETRGHSEEGRSISLVTWGRGSTKIFLWSQMHGNEATGTMALFDLINFLQKEAYQAETSVLAESCTLYLLPMVNPDGAERFIRRNSRQIDINRDFTDTLTAEAKLLRALRDEINPDFGFNLHDQDTLWSVQDSLKSATLSYLAPSFDSNLSFNETRVKAMKVIAEIFDTLKTFLPGRIGLFNDEFEPRAFGDNFQLSGTSTILLEAGGYKEDYEKQEVRKYFFLSILKGLMSIALRSFQEKTVEAYLSIPKNDKQLFHVLIQQVTVNSLFTSVGLNYEDVYFQDRNEVVRKYYVIDIGDLRYCNSYSSYKGEHLKINKFLAINSLADFELLQNDKIILSFSDGILTQYLNLNPLRNSNGIK